MSNVHGVALVTGGGAGLGRACAMTLAERGARVAVHYMKSRDGAEEVVAALKAAGAEAQAFQGDLTKSADVTALVDAVTARFGSIDILVNNAGDLDRAKTAARDERRVVSLGDGRERHQRVSDVPRRGRRHGRAEARHHHQHVVARRLERRRSGRRRLLGGQRRHRLADQGAGEGTGAARHPRQLRRARTDRRDGVSRPLHAPAAFETAAKGVLLGRAGTPDEVATVVAFLASADSSFLTGETIEINGGMNMR